MLQKAFEILKARWPEALLIVVFQAGLMVLVHEISLFVQAADTQKTQIPFWAAFMLGMGSMACMTVALMLFLGFLRTAATDGTQLFQPVELIRTGQPYFWRVMLFQIWLFFMWMLFAGSLAGLAGSIFMKIQDPQKLPGWLVETCFIITSLFLIKPVLLVTAKIIVYNTTAVQAFFTIWQYRLRDIQDFIKQLVVILAIIIVFSLLPNMASEGTVIYYILMGLNSIVSSFASLVLMMIAVLWLQEKFDAEQKLLSKDIDEA